MMAIEKRLSLPNKSSQGNKNGEKKTSGNDATDFHGCFPTLFE